MGVAGNIFGQIVGIVIYILFLKNLSDLLLAVQPGNRKIQPTHVWLLLLWLLKAVFLLVFSFGIVQYTFYDVVQIIGYIFTALFIVLQLYIVVKIADSISAEYDSREIYYEN